MSSMLEQAIIDADALREAAVKNAETLVLEKYNNQIKEAVEMLLEQEEPALEAGLTGDAGAAMDPMADLGMPTLPEGEDPEALEEEEPESSVMEHIPNAAKTKVEQAELVEIPLDALLEEINAMRQEVLFEGDEVHFEEQELEEDLDEEQGLDEDLDEEQGLDEDLDEEIALEELDEELLNALAEQMTVHLNPKTHKDGWAGTSQSVIALAEEELLALEQDSKVKEEKKLMRQALKSLEEVNETVLRQNAKLQHAVKNSTTQFNKLKKIVITLKEKLEQSNLSNAKLLYQNKALDSDSLNERQKHKLVEAISNADSVEEAKIIFETLQSTVGSTSRKSQPKSLSEAVQKSSSMILSARKESARRQKENPTLERWKFLAGIDK